MGCLCLQELKECGGRVFVDSQPEFCLPEVFFPPTATLLSTEECLKAGITLVFICKLLEILRMCDICEVTNNDPVVSISYLVTEMIFISPPC